ncbi:MAG TPA: ferrous iron transport protein B [Bacteroidaceae bacterium]|nr:ferrous iron transport protein B [Bacteroidaceae bacterium]
MHLSDLATGQRGVIAKVRGHGGFRKRIIEMGFVKGQPVKVLLNAPLKDPVKYRIMDYEVSLRREEARLIDVITEEEVKAKSKQENTSYFGTLTDETTNDDYQKLMQQAAEEKHRVINVALVGNPNCGKTSLFNQASGACEHVGNYSGVTVDAKEGHMTFKGYSINIVDLPGTYSVSAYTPEELYVRRYIIKQTPDVIINVVDSSNLERNLYLTTQLIDMNVRTVMALNMYDELKTSGNIVDIDQLGTLFGMPVIPTVSKTGEGIDELFDTVIKIYNDKEEKARHIHINHGPDIELCINKIQEAISQNEEIRHRFSTRFLAIKLLENDHKIRLRVMRLPNAEQIMRRVYKAKKYLQSTLRDDSESLITDAKYGFISGALKETFTVNSTHERKLTKALDEVLTHKYLGFPLFFLFMYIMFQMTFTLGQFPMDWIEQLVAGLNHIAHSYIPEGPIKDMIVDGIISGVGGVIVFLPNIMILYFFIALMEDSGYMARAAFIMDRIMHRVGLHGKSFIPLIMGFGCNVPAVMATRTIEDRKSRLITMLINPFMSCSARLPVYLVFVGYFFKEYAGAVLFSMYIIGIIIAMLAAIVFNKWLIKGESTPFVMELPPYRLPTMQSLWRHTWEKGKQYIAKMGGIIMIASIVIWFLGYYPRYDISGASTIETSQVNAQTVNNNTEQNNVNQITRSDKENAALLQQEHSLMGMIGHAIEPALKPLGFDWRLGIGLLSGVGAKELVVSTLCVIYGTSEDTVENGGLAQHMHITPLIAFGYMLFCLIYFPCIATLAAIKNESGHWKWALFSATYTTALAWILSFLVFQIGSIFI